MDSRDLLRSTTSFSFVYDAESLNQINDTQIDVLDKLVYYKHYPKFNFIRTDADSTRESVRSLEPIMINNSPNRVRALSESSGHDLISVIYEDQNGEKAETTSFHPLEYSTQNIDNPHPIESRELRLVNIFNRIRGDLPEGEEAFFITANSEILKNRRRLESDITSSGGALRKSTDDQLHIVTPKEAGEVAGLFMRNQDDFIYYRSYDHSGSYEIGLMLWSLSLTRIFLQYSSGKGYIGSMLDRFDSLFIAIDNVGEQYYSGADNHTDMRTRYHFNNGVSLLTGITDVLALYIRDECSIDIPDRKTNLRIGDRHLLPKLRNHNEKLYNYIHQNHPMIEILHIIRNNIIHQEGVITRGPGYTIQEEWETDWNSQHISLETIDSHKIGKISKYYRQLSDSEEEYDPVTKWGIINPEDGMQAIHEHTAIEPYRFLKQSTFRMAEFADRCLELLGQENRFDNLDDSGFVSKSNVNRIMDHDLFPLVTIHRSQ